MLSIISKLLNKIKKRELKKYIQWKFSLGNATFAAKVCLLKIKNSNFKNELPFQVVNSSHGRTIVNINDQYISKEIISNGSWEINEVNFLKSILIQSREKYGNGVVALDCGANLGVHTLEFSRLMKDWGYVYSFEPQRQIFHSLCGSLALNDIKNVTVQKVALGAEEGVIDVPVLDYKLKKNYGGLELSQNTLSKIDNQPNLTEHEKLSLITLDSLKFLRVDLIKIDIEGMELEAFFGAENILVKLKPIIFYESSKSDESKIKNYLKSKNYTQFINLKNNTLAINRDSKIQL
jgi:FkbM family methyltransferase